MAAFRAREARRGGIVHKFHALSAIKAARNVEMCFVFHVELSSIPIYRSSNLIKQFLAFLWYEHPIVRPCKQELAIA
jgi:hypothetical protein